MSVSIQNCEQIASNIKRILTELNFSRDKLFLSNRICVAEYVDHSIL